jgi:hypothetical protein
VSGPPPQCAQLRQRPRPPGGPYLDSGSHLAVNAPAFSCTRHVEQLLGACAVKAWAVVLMSGRTGHRAIADHGDQF